MDARRASVRTIARVCARVMRRGRVLMGAKGVRVVSWRRPGLHHSKACCINLSFPRYLLDLGMASR